MLLQELGAPLGSEKHDFDYSIREIVEIGKQTLALLKDLHSKEVLHTDIKPDNILRSSPTQKGIEDLRLIDFGESLVLNKKDLKVGDSRSNINPFFHSANAIQGSLVSFKDDLFSLIYSLIFLMEKDLPWCTSDDQSVEDICEAKRDILKSKFGAQLPQYFKDLLQYTESLKATEMPDYDFLISKSSPSITARVSGVPSTNGSDDQFASGCDSSSVSSEGVALEHSFSDSDDAMWDSLDIAEEDATTESIEDQLLRKMTLNANELRIRGNKYF